jgi:uncharacterized protein (TIGR01777 family)
MDVVVSGASGMIGSALVAALAADGHRPIELVRRPTPGDTLRWDPEAGTIDRHGLEGVDAVVHLAGEGIATNRWSDEQKRRILESRTVGTSLIASTLARLDRPPKVLVSASAIGYYGERGDVPLTEQEPPGRSFLSEVVVAWEAAAQPAADAGIRVVHPRTGIVLSPHEGALAKMLPLFKLGLGGRFGNGRQYMSWISLHDEVQALIWLLDHDVSGPVNLTGPRPVTNAEFARALGGVLHRPSLLPVPAFGPKLVVGRELATELLFTSIRAVPRKLLDSGFEFAHTDVTSALSAVLQK